jgi:hypothetical protein
MRKEIPNDSISVIHADDVGKMFVSCARNSTAQHRYFGVKQAYSWTTILKEIQNSMGAFEMAPTTHVDPAPVPEFNKQRQTELLKGAGMDLELIDLPTMIHDTVEFFQTTDPEFSFGREGEPMDDPVICGITWRPGERERLASTADESSPEFRQPDVLYGSKSNSNNNTTATGSRSQYSREVDSPDNSVRDLSHLRWPLGVGGHKPSFPQGFMYGRTDSDTEGSVG